MLTKPKLSKDEIGTLLLLAAILFGGIFRLLPAWLAGFPINDGGMFYTMILDLQANHYAIPVFTTYNHAAIPFAYPPLGFYIGAGLSDLFNISPLSIICWLPGVINALCVPVFYVLAKEFLNDKLTSATATLVYALNPHLTSWPSMGGGLTRALGAFFMLLAITHIYRAFARENKKSIWWAIIFGSLTILSHTEAPAYTAVIAIYIWAMKSRTLKGIQNGLAIALGVLLLTAPWYGTIIFRHGAGVFSSAIQTGLHSSWSILRLINLDFMTEEPYLDLLGVLSILGIATLVSRKDFFIPGLLLVIALALPRSAHIVGNIPLAIAAGFFINGILLPKAFNASDNPDSQSRKLVLASLVLIPYIFSNSVQFAFLLSGNHVSEAEQDAMQWTRKNTPADSKFLVFTGETNPFCDSTNEWFPSLTERESLTTLQGREWLLGKNFGGYISYTQGLQSCIDNGLDCMTDEVQHYGTEFKYVYISILAPTQNCQIITQFNRKTRSLITELKDSPQYSIVYLSESTAIFERK